MDKMIVKKWEDICSTGMVNPYSKCSCCDINSPISYIQIGQSLHPAASFQLCNTCLINFSDCLTYLQNHL